MTTTTTTRERPIILPERDARRAGYALLAGPYHPDTEDWQLENCIEDQRLARADVVLVTIKARHAVGQWSGLSVWRRQWK